jgi:hypothetical protein
MGFDPVSIAIVGLGFQAASFVMNQGAKDDQADAARAQAAATERQAEAQRKQAEIAQRKADMDNARATRAAIRQSRIARASVMNTGANAGTFNSSGVLGGVGSIGSQLGSNMGYFTGQQDANAQITAAQGQQADAIIAGGYAAADAQVAQGNAAQAGAIGGLGQSIFNAAGGFKTIFG